MGLVARADALHLALGYRDGASLVETAAEALWHHDERGPWPGAADELRDPYRDQAAYVLVAIAARAWPADTLQ